MAAARSASALAFASSAALVAARSASALAALVASAACFFLSSSSANISSRESILSLLSRVGPSPNISSRESTVSSLASSWTPLFSRASRTNCSAAVSVLSVFLVASVSPVAPSALPEPFLAASCLAATLSLACARALAFMAALRSALRSSSVISLSATDVVAGGIVAGCTGREGAGGASATAAGVADRSCPFASANLASSAASSSSKSLCRFFSFSSSGFLAAVFEATLIFTLRPLSAFSSLATSPCSSSLP